MPTTNTPLHCGVSEIGLDISALTSQVTHAGLESKLLDVSNIGVLEIGDTRKTVSFHVFV
jgi:hypothetical protein